MSSERIANVERRGGGISRSTIAFVGCVALIAGGVLVAYKVRDYADSLEWRRQDAWLNAAREGDREHIEREIASGFDVDFSEPGGETAMHMAALGGRKEIIGVLIDAGANIEARDSSGRTPLFFAIKGHDEDTLTFLLDHGADPTVEDASGETPMQFAMAVGDADLANVLKKAMDSE